MSSRNPFGDTSRGRDDDRNTVGGGSSGGSSDGTTGGSTGGSSSDGGGGRDRDDDAPASRNPFDDTTRGREDDRNTTGSSSPSSRVGDDRNQTADPDPVSTDLPRTPDSVGGAEFRQDTVARRSAQTVADIGGDIGRGVTDSALDVVGAEPGADREIVEDIGETLGQTPGDALETGVDVGQGFTSVTRAGARKGPAAAFEQTQDLTADAADAGLRGADQLLDVDFDRRAAGEGAAVQVEEANRDSAAVTATVSALTLAGGSVGATSTGLGIRSAASRAGPDSSRGGTSTGVEADPVASGRSDVGTGGLDSILDPDTVGSTSLRDTDVEPDTNDVGVEAADTGADSLPLESAVQQSGGVRRFLDEQRQTFEEFRSADRGQLQPGSQRDRPGTDRDPTQPSDAGGSFADVRQDALTQQQDFLSAQARSDLETRRGVTANVGDIEAQTTGSRRDAVATFEQSDLVDTSSPGPARPRDPGQNVPEVPTTTAAGIPTGRAFGGGLGSLAAVNDPSGILDRGGADLGGGIAGTVVGAGPDTGLGADTLAGTTDPTAIQPDTDVETGSTVDTVSDTETDTGVAADTDQRQDQRQDFATRTDLTGGFEAGITTRVDTETRSETRLNTETETRSESVVRGETETRVETNIQRPRRLDVPDIELDEPRDEDGLNLELGVADELLVNPTRSLDAVDDDISSIGGADVP